MKTEATVISLEGAFATVETERTSACEGCHQSFGEKGCSVCSLMGGERKISSRASNPIGAKLGDRVVIESRTDRMLWYAVLVFLLPVVMALLFYGVAAALTESMGVRIVFALLGFLGTFLCLSLYSSRVQKKRCDIVITEILKKG